MLPATITVSQQGLAAVMTDANIGEPHLVLDPVAEFREPAEAEQLHQQAWAQFADLGLLDRRGLNIEVAESLGVLCRAPVEFYGWIGIGEHITGVLAAAIGRDAILAKCTEGQVTLRGIRSTELAAELVATLPQSPPTRFRAISVPVSDLSRLSGKEPRPADGSILRSVSAGNLSPQLRDLKRIVTAPSLGGGELYAALRDRMGRVHRSPHSLGYTDSELGRTLNLIRTERGGEPYAIFTPAAPADLIGRLHDMHRALQA
ncbi:MAG: ESX secretion-associated protein EspG [Sciscionella sp.]